MESVADLLSFISGFFDAIWTYLSETVVQVLKDFAEWLTVSLTIGWIESKIWLLKFSWGVASTVLESFDVSSVISGYVSALSPDVAYVADTSGLFDGANLIMQAYVSSMVLRMTGF